MVDSIATQTVLCRHDYLLVCQWDVFLNNGNISGTCFTCICLVFLFDCRKRKAQNRHGAEVNVCCKGKMVDSTSDGTVKYIVSHCV
jgi:hypothetical protein